VRGVHLQSCGRRPELVKRAKVTMVVQVTGSSRAYRSAAGHLDGRRRSRSLEDAAISAVLAGATPSESSLGPPRLVNIIV